MLRFVSQRGMGLLMEREVKFLGKLLGDVERPFMAVIGGAKVSDKIGVLENLLGRGERASTSAAAMANTFLKAKGGAPGPLAARGGPAGVARSFLRKAEERGRAGAAAARRGGGRRHPGRRRARWSRP